MVQDTQQAVTEWSQQISELRNQYTWLLYFSIPRMLKLYMLMHSEELEKTEKVDKIVCEVSFLATNQQTEREKLRLGVEVCL